MGSRSCPESLNLHATEVLHNVRCFRNTEAKFITHEYNLAGRPPLAFRLPRTFVPTHNSTIPDINTRVFCPSPSVPHYPTRGPHALSPPHLAEQACHHSPAIPVPSPAHAPYVLSVNKVSTLPASPSYGLTGALSMRAETQPSCRKKTLGIPQASSR